MRHHLTECSCGSGLWPNENYDARGLFLCYSCDQCHIDRLSVYRPDVLTDSDYWHDESVDGDEWDCGYSLGNDYY
jgi:hypothetical protein